jgi:predicted PurR-regulated permease PerM
MPGPTPPANPRSLGITVLAVLAVFYTLYLARAFFLPIAFALLFDFLFRPAVRGLARFRVPLPVGAALVVLGLIGLGGLAVYGLSGPVQTWAEHSSETVATAQRRLRRLLQPLQRVTKTAQQVESAAGGVAGGAPEAPEVVVRGPSIVSRLFGSTQRFLAAALEVLILLYFLLAAGDLLLQRLVRGLPRLRDRQKAVEITRATESSVSTYLLTAAAVNLIEGVVVTGVMYLVGMPNAPLWGALVFVLEFIPYLGAVTMTVILTIAALATFDEVGRALLVPAAFVTINLIQANFVAPFLLGRRLALNPVALVISIAFWFWIWGIPGAFIAVPLLATFKILCDHVETLAPIGEFLGRQAPGEARAPIA